MTAHITVERVTNPWVDRMRRYKIEINGHLVGSVPAGESIVFDAPPGPVAVRARIDWTGSKTWTADLADGEHVTLVVGHDKGDTLTGMFSRNRYLSLVPKPQHTGS